MADNLSTNIPVAASTGQAAPVSAGASSPWNEELPEEQPKTKVVGTLHNQTPAASPAPSSFALPQDIENKTGLNIVNPANLSANSTPVAENPVANTPIDPAVPDTPVPTEPPVSAVEQVQAAPSEPTTGNNTDTATAPDNSFSYSFEGPKVAPVVGNEIGARPANGQTASNDILSSPVAAPAPEPKNPFADLAPFPKPEPETPAAPLSTSDGVSDQVVPETPPEQLISSETAIVEPPAVSTAEMSTQAPALPADDISSQPMPEKKGIFSFLSRHKPTEVPVQTEQTDLPGQSTMISAPSPIAKKMMIPGIIIGVVAIFALAAYLTEIGLLSLGLEKVYGAVGIEQLWGGLPASTEGALARSFVAMQDHRDFKVMGHITLNIDKTIKNSVMTPLVSMDDSARFAVMPIRALLAVDTTTDSTTTDYSTSTDSASSVSTDSSSTSADSAQSSVVTAPVDQASEASYLDISTTKQIDADLDGFFSSQGNELNLNVAKPIGTSTINLKNTDSKLWVKSDQTKFDTLAESGKWLAYDFSQLSGKSIANEIFAIDSSSGFSAKGIRLGNEKVGDVRCFKYNLESAEIGDALNGLGISSDAVKSATGTFWVGIKDKLLRKAELKITTGNSYPVTQINLSIELSDFDTTNDFSIPTESSLVDMTKPAAQAVATSVPDITPAILTSDETRKADLASIKSAIDQYYTANKSYPLAKTEVKLSTATNILIKKLVPTYLAALPKDPKSGWYYRYKSDGKTYTLSARLEDTADTSGKLTSGVYLYILKSE